MRLPLLPDNPEETEAEAAVSLGRFPSWLHRPLPQASLSWETHQVLEGQRLPTVCEEARCPNLPECYGKKTATFLTMGKECTRSCGFCSIDFSKQPRAPDVEEPERLARSVELLGLKHVVLTMVARDDLEDGGAGHLVAIVERLRLLSPRPTVEVLTSDFAGNVEAWEKILGARPEIFNHNIETVRALTPRVRHKATYERTLELLAYAKAHGGARFVKSGLMLGLGESVEEVEETLRDLHGAGCDIVTIGHYLQPDRHKLRVKAFVAPEQFEAYASYGRSLGIGHVYAGPFVRSSYNAAELFASVAEQQTVNM